MEESSDLHFSVRRRFPRYPCSGVAEILLTGKLWGWGTVSDISRGGCYIEMAQLLSVGTEVQIRLTLSETLLDTGAKVVSNHPMFGMGMEFMLASQEQEYTLAQILRKINHLDVPPPAQKVEQSRPGAATVRITREAAPDILTKVIKRINEKGVLTKQELVDIVKTTV